MKSLSSLIAVGAITLGLASPAFASSDYKFKNIGPFTGKGSMTVTSIAVSVPCQVTLKGTTDGAGTTITAATFSGATCIAISPSGLPWSLHANAAHSMTIRDVTVRAVVLGICGAGLPSSLGATPCSVSGTLTTSPKLEIVAKP
jgi:hypothetical protein